jgi:hypothetical protein
MLTERTGIRIETVRLAEYHKQTVARHQVIDLRLLRLSESDAEPLQQFFPERRW